MIKKNNRVALVGIGAMGTALAQTLLENEIEIQNMLSAGESDNQIVNYLIYKLADLYHIEGN